VVAKTSRPIPPVRRLCYTLNEAATALGISRSGLRRWVERGLIPTFKWGNRTLIRADDLQDAFDRASGRTSERQDRCGRSGEAEP